ncbi:hypothetical protein GQ42DRAFT_170348 [Ramicandelaber brevisporus]|nr:hypothetical protein GQ42DRAFT_170348 [Ramicandelaber brevisporus]
MSCIIRKLEGNVAPILCVEASNDGLLVSCDQLGFGVVREFDPNGSGTSTVKGMFIVGGGKEQPVSIKFTSRTTNEFYVATNAAVYKITRQPTGELFVSEIYRQVVLSEEEECDINDMDIRAGSVSDEIIVALDNGHLKMFNSSNSNDGPTDLDAHRNICMAVRYIPNTPLCISGSLGCDIIVHDTGIVADGAHGMNILDISSFSADADKSSDAGVTQMFNPPYVNTLAVTQDGKNAFGGLGDGRVLWHKFNTSVTDTLPKECVGECEFYRVLDSPVSHVAVAKFDSTVVIVGGHEDEVALCRFEPDTKNFDVIGRVKVPNMAAVHCITSSPLFKHIFVAGVSVTSSAKDNNAIHQWFRLTAIASFLAVILAVFAYASTDDNAASPLSVELSSLSRANSPTGIIQLDTAEARRFYHGVRQRDYALAVLFNGLNANLGCGSCKKFKEEYAKVARGWSKQHNYGMDANAPRMYFLELDLDNAREIFHEVQVTSVPAVLFYPATKGKYAASSSASGSKKKAGGVGGKDSMSLSWRSSRRPEYVAFDQSEGNTAESLADFLEKQIHSPVPVYSRINYTLYATNFLGIASILVVGYLSIYDILAFLSKRAIWQGFSLIFILIMCTGFMWISIRGPPFIGGNAQGEPEMFARGISKQYGVETQIMAILYGAASLCVTAMILKLPRIADVEKRSAVSMLALFVFIFIYSVIVRIFGDKNGFYPFSIIL